MKQLFFPVAACLFLFFPSIPGTSEFLRSPGSVPEYRSLFPIFLFHDLFIRPATHQAQLELIRVLIIDHASFIFLAVAFFLYIWKIFLLLPDTYFAGIPGRASEFCLRQMRMESDTSYNKAISGPCLALPFLFLCFSVCGMGEWGSWEVGVEGGRFSGNPVSGADSECNREITFLHMPWKQDCPKICVLQDGRGAPELYSRS